MGEVVRLVVLVACSLAIAFIAVQLMMLANTISTVLVFFVTLITEGFTWKL